MMRSMRRQQGFGIIQMVILASVILAAALVISSYLDRQGRLSKLRRQNSKYQLLVDHLQQQLNDAFICTSALSGQQVSTSIGTWAPVTLQMGYGDSAGPIGAGWKAANAGYELRELQMKPVRQAQMKEASGNIVPRTVVYDYPRVATTSPNSFLKYYARLRIEPSDAHWDTENEEGYVKLALIVNSAGRLHQCFGEFSPAEACESNGGSYDVSLNSNPEERCNPDIFCFNHAIGLTGDQSACSYPYLPNPMGYIDGQYKYLCTWCNRNR